MDEHPATPADDEPGVARAAVVVRSGAGGLVVGILSPTLLVALGVAALRRGYAPLPAALVVLGVALLAAVLLDLPRRAVLDHDGILRVAVLRRQRLGWDRVVAVERMPPSALGRLRGASGGGLVARGRRRRWLLADRTETAVEHGRLRDLLASLDPPVPLRATSPTHQPPRQAS